MKLDTEFVKLPLLFDIDRLREEVAQFDDDDWLTHTTGYRGNMGIPLVSLNGEVNDAMHGPMQATAALQRCAYIQQIMRDFDEVFGRSRLMRLEPGHDVPPHIDANYHWYHRVRIHIPITTTEDVLFYCGDQHVHMAAGECWIFNSWLEHTVKNNSDKTRVHLVLDTAGSVRFWDLVERGDWPFADRKSASEKPRRVVFDSASQGDVKTETYNVPLVQSPGELENLVNALTGDIAIARPADAEARQLFLRFTNSFIRAWREVWAVHAYKPSGWPYYHSLVNEARSASLSVAPDLTLASNGAGLCEAFRSLVLFSAINEEFAPQYLGQDELPDNLQPAVRQFAAGKGAAQKAADNESDAMAVPEHAKTLSRNEPCWCNSGKRFKHCHGAM